MIALNTPENVAKNIEKLKLSLDNKMDNKFDGFLNIDLRPKTKDTPVLMQ